MDWFSDYNGPSAQDLLDLYRQGLLAFVPAFGIGEGAYEAVTTGSPTGAAKFFVPGIGIAEGVVGGGVSAYNLSAQPVRNAISSTGNLLLLAGGVTVIIILLLKK